MAIYFIFTLEIHFRNNENVGISLSSVYIKHSLVTWFIEMLENSTQIRIHFQKFIRNVNTTAAYAADSIWIYMLCQNIKQ